MLKIKNTLVSLDLVERHFSCDLQLCRGACCIEGDAGAPIQKDEELILQQILPTLLNDLSPDAKVVALQKGIAYTDPEGERVTSIVDGRDCIFTYKDEDGICKCLIEKAFHQGRISFQKPISCRLYPVRIKEYTHYQAVNYDRQPICKCAEKHGSQTGTPLYRYLKDALIDKFGQEWYADLHLCAQEWDAAGSKSQSPFSPPRQSY